MENRRKYLSGSGKTLSLLVGMLLCGTVSQVSAQNTAPVLSLQEAINTGINNSWTIKGSILEVTQQEMLRGTRIDLNQTDLSFEYGQINSAANDNKVSLSQDFSLPNVYSSRSNLTSQQIISSKYRLAVSKAELTRNIKLAFFQLLYAEEKRKLFQYQDSLYSNFQKANEINYKVGEGTYLEKTAAEARQMEIKNQLFQVESDIRVYKTQLQKLLNITNDFNVASDSTFYILSAPVDTNHFERSPYMEFYRQQIAINKAQTQVERNKLFPELSIGITSQTIRGFQNTTGAEEFYGSGSRFNYVQGGIGIPIFFGSQKARINASRIGEQIAETNYQSQKLQVENELKRLVEEYLKYQNTIQYYKTKGIPHANLIIEFSTKSYKLGETGYFDYIQYLTQALQSKIAYLENIHQNNQTIIQIEYLTGQSK